MEWHSSIPPLLHQRISLFPLSPEHRPQHLTLPSAKPPSTVVPLRRISQLRYKETVALRGVSTPFRLAFRRDASHEPQAQNRNHVPHVQYRKRAADYTGRLARRAPAGGEHRKRGRER